VANKFADMIRPYDTNTDPHPGRIAANKFADMIRPFVGGLPPTFSLLFLFFCRFIQAIHEITPYCK
jgi:hypothetical protein